MCPCRIALLEHDLPQEVERLSLVTTHFLYAQHQALLSQCVCLREIALVEVSLYQAYECEGAVHPAPEIPKEGQALLGQGACPDVVALVEGNIRPVGKRTSSAKSISRLFGEGYAFLEQGFCCCIVALYQRDVPQRTETRPDAPCVFELSGQCQTFSVTLLGTIEFTLIEDQVPQIQKRLSP